MNTHPTLLASVLLAAALALTACQESAAHAPTAAPAREAASGPAAPTGVTPSGPAPKHSTSAASAPPDALDCGPVLETQQRGVAYAHSTRRGGYGSDASRASLEELAALGVDWITITPFGWMEAADSPEVVLNTSGRGESDASLRAVTAQARALGIHVVLKPHLWLRGEAWRGDIAFADEAGWDAWFASYTRFIVHYAELAQELHLDLLVIGVELRSSTVAHPERWRDVIRAVREVYDGPLTYAANWDEVEHVPFWDALDYIGVQMFAPLATDASATRGDLERRAREYLERYSRVSEAFDRPLLLTEVGFRSLAGTAVSPWLWPDRRDDTPVTPTDEAAQVDGYCAIIRTFGRSPRVAGMYWWKWFSDPDRSDGPSGFSPRGKPALTVLRNAFRGPSLRSRGQQEALFSAPLVR